MKFWTKIALLCLLAIATFVLWEKQRPPTVELTAPLKGQPAQNVADSSLLDSAVLDSDPTPLEETLDPRDHLSEVSDQQLNSQDEAGMTPLLLAIDSERPDIALKLIERGANPNLADIHGTTPLMAAAVQGEAALIEALLLKGADTNTHLDLIGTTLLMHAAREGMMDVAQVLIKFGASVNQQNQTGQTALMLAADMGQAEMIDLLLSEGADRTLQDGQGKRAFDFAQARGLEALSRKLRP